MHAIVGHNCRFLQGPDTDRDEVNKLKVALTEGREEVVIVKNYRKDGTNFFFYFYLLSFPILLSQLPIIN